MVIKEDLPSIRETVVCEGRDDAAVIERAVIANIITTHGFGISRGTWDLIDKAYKGSGIIILTDPDHAGEEIRARIAARYPDAKHAYLPRELARDGSDIGVENARPSDVTKALLEARATIGAPEASEVTEKLLFDLGLTGTPGSQGLRRRVMAELGVGYGNGRAFVKKARGFGISREEIIRITDEVKGKIEAEDGSQG